MQKYTLQLITIGTMLFGVATATYAHQAPGGNYAATCQNCFWSNYPTQYGCQCQYENQEWNPNTTYANFTHTQKCATNVNGGLQTCDCSSCS